MKFTSRTDAPQDIKAFVRKTVPKPARSAVRASRTLGPLVHAYSYDLIRYWKHSSTWFRGSRKKNLRALITERYHSVEKGLSLSEPRPGFGEKPIGELIDYIELYVRNFGVEDVVRDAVGALNAYLRFNEASGINKSLIPHLERLTRLGHLIDSANSDAGSRVATRDQVLSTVNGVTLDFFQSRRSIRQFSRDPVSREDIEWAAEAAMQAPAVCNRQFSKLRVFMEATEVAEILDIQGGARGFRDEVSAVAIVTTSATSYWNVGQRNQGWVDGGLYAMSFILGLHARGLGSIALNWSKSPKKDQELRNKIDLPEDEMVIMLIGFGNLKEHYRVASSTRVPLSESLKLKL